MVMESQSDLWDCHLHGNRALKRQGLSGFLSVAVSVRHREDCYPRNWLPSLGQLRVYSLPRQLSVFPEQRPMVYVKCHGKYGSIWARILHVCCISVTQLKCHNNLCILYTKILEVKLSSLYKLGFLTVWFLQSLHY